MAECFFFWEGGGVQKGGFDAPNLCLTQVFFVFFQNLVALRANRPKVEFCGFRWLWQKWWMFNLVLRDGFSRNAWQRKVVFEIPRSARVVCFALDLQFSNIALFLFSSPLLLCEYVSAFPSIFLQLFSTHSPLSLPSCLYFSLSNQLLFSFSALFLPFGKII